MSKEKDIYDAVPEQYWIDAYHEIITLSEVSDATWEKIQKELNNE